jgi:hypothetical protein
MLPDPKVKCPATGFARSCREILAECDCPKWVHLQGKNPQTGADIDQYGCVDGFLPHLLIENALVGRQTGAAVETLRNQIAAAQRGDLGLMLLANQSEALPLLSSLPKS